jgi:hypothetical protein
MRTIDERLSAYFAGDHEGQMGLKSFLGSWVRNGPQCGGGGYSSPPEGPSAQALLAAREMTRVEGALRLMKVSDAAVLAAYYTPRGPHAPLASLGALGAVVAVLEERARAIVAELDDAAQREALRSPDAGQARYGMEIAVDAEFRVVSLDLAGRRGVKLKQRLSSMASGALASAQSAFREALEQEGRASSEARAERFMAGLV